MNSKSSINIAADTVATKAEHAVFSDMGMSRGEIKDKVQNLQEKAMHFRDDATNYVKENYIKVREKSLEMEDKVITYVRQNPIKAVGISMLAGMVLTKLLRRK